MTAYVPYINGVLTLVESSFNVIGYLPKNRFPHLNAWSTNWRIKMGSTQTIVGLALFTLGLLGEYLGRKPNPSKYLNLYQQMMSLGLFYANHGMFNIIRAYVEKQGYGALTAAYDFYGRKILPALSPSFDLQNQLFERIKLLLDRVLFITFLPPSISFRSLD
jgi:hypothetical protein